jgi:hypothetical protein
MLAKENMDDFGLEKGKERLTEIVQEFKKLGCTHGCKREARDGVDSYSLSRVFKPARVTDRACEGRGTS